MTQVLIYVSGIGDHAAVEAIRRAAVDYCLSHGWSQPISIPQDPSRGHPGLRSECYIEEAIPGPLLLETMRRLSNGAVLLVSRLADFGTRPSEQRARIRELQGRDVSVHILGLGPIDNVMSVLKASWDAAAPMEEQLLQMEKDYAQHEAQLAERMSRFEDRLVARLSELRGHQTVKEFYGLNGNSTPEQPVEVTDETALHVRGLREAKGMSQEQLAAAAGVSKSQVQRIEASGRGTELARVLSVLEHEGWQPPAPTKWVEEQSQ
jgi:DNA-binding XRE family transcriptional regulator